MGVTLQQREWTGEFLHPFALDVDHHEDIFVNPKMAWLVLPPETQETVVSSGRKKPAPQKKRFKIVKTDQMLAQVRVQRFLHQRAGSPSRDNNTAAKRSHHRDLRFGEHAHTNSQLYTHVFIFLIS